MIEMLIAVAISALTLVAVMGFIFYSARAISGVTAQAVINQKAGNTIEFIQSRVRYATYLSNSVSGNVLTLGFDDDYNVDSDGNLRKYDDRNHYERFQFIGVNSTNVTACASNKLVYYANINSGVSNVLIPSGVRNLPNKGIFAMTNQVIVIYRFGVVDSLGRDKYQAVDIQGTGVSLNRLWNTNVLAIYP